jgi:ParB-like chromosome segregation protein Spo0J
MSKESNDTYKTRPGVTARPGSVPLSRLVVQPEEFGLREANAYDPREGQAMADLIEDIRRTGGIHTPIMAAQRGEHLLVYEGHRRFFALRHLAASPDAPAFDDDMLVPVLVVPEDVPPDELLARGISANTNREPLPPVGRARGAHRLRCAGWAVAQIAETFAVSTKTIERDLAIAGSEWALGHVEAHSARYTTMVGLYAEAAAASRLSEWQATFDRHVADLREHVAEMSRRRVAQGKDPLTAEQSWPQRYLRRKVIDSWLTALKHGRPLDTPARLRFSAAVAEDDKGAITLEISSLRVPLKQVELDELADVFTRLVDCADALKPHLLSKQQGQPTTTEGTRSPGREALARLGIHRADAEDDDPGEEDADFGETGARAESGLDEEDEAN